MPVSRATLDRERMINDFYARSGIPPGTKVRLSAQLDGLTEQWMTMMKSTYFSDIPVRSVAERSGAGDVRKIGTRLESS